MVIVRFDPSAFQERLNRLIPEFYSRQGEDDAIPRGTWVPPVDIHENGDHELIVNIELPDVKREDMEITVDSGTLMIRGEKRKDTSKEENCHRVERSYGAFSRSFWLPPTVDSTKVSAEYKNGLLTVRLPQREEAKPKQIQVQVVE